MFPESGIPWDESRCNSEIDITFLEIWISNGGSGVHDIDMKDMVDNNLKEQKYNS
jgi:hypothetical protein